MTETKSREKITVIDLPVTALVLLRNTLTRSLTTRKWQVLWIAYTTKAYSLLSPCAH